MWNRKRGTGTRLTSRSAETTEPVPGHSAIRPTTSSVASRNSLPSPGRCSSNQRAATCNSSSASADNSTGSVTERAWRGLAHVRRATVVPDPRRTKHVVRVARVPSPTQPGQRRGRRARPDRGCESFDLRQQSLRSAPEQRPVTIDVEEAPARPRWPSPRIAPPHLPAAWRHDRPAASRNEAKSPQSSVLSIGTASYAS